MRGPGKQRQGAFRLAIVWLALLLLGSFWLTGREGRGGVSLTVLPEVPRPGEPVIATFRLSNPTPHPVVRQYEFYANGRLLQQGEVALPPGSSKKYQFVYRNAQPLGEGLSFVLRTRGKEGRQERAIASPPYPPQVWSSFVSFASFSTSVMSSMSSTTYYQQTFTPGAGFNIGFLSSLVLISLLIFLEITQPLLQERSIPLIGRLRVRFSTLTWVLFVIFMAMFYTRIVMLI